MSFAKMTLIGLTNYGYTDAPYGPGTDLWDLLNLPEGIDKETVVNNIIMRGGEFEVLYPDYNYMRAFIGVWSNKHYRTFQKWIEALSLEYNPLENYNRTEEYTDIGTNGQTRTGSRSNSITGSDTIRNTGTVTDQTAYNSTNTEGKSGSDTTTRTDNLSEGINQTTTDNKLQTSTTNGTVTQSVDTKNNQTQTVTNTDLGSDKVHSVSAFNSNDAVFSDSDQTSGANTAVTAYSGQADNETTMTSVQYRSGTDGDTVANTGTVGVTSTKTNTGTERTENSYASQIANAHTGTDTDTRTDDLTETKTSSLTDTGSDSDTISGNTRMEHRAHLYGNIGVTTSQQMLQAELDISAWNIYEKITDLFLDEFCIKVY